MQQINRVFFEIIKLVFVASVLIFVFFSSNVNARDYPVPGVDDYQSMLSMLGKPRSIEITSDGHNYHYQDVTVNISGEDAPKVLSISFWRPNVYKKYSNLDVGMKLQDIRSRLTDYYEHHDGAVNFIADYERGIIFWLEKDRVVKLVQVKRGSLKRVQ